MARHYASHLQRLASEADDRFRRLMQVLDTGRCRGTDIVVTDGCAARLAADDFKTILAEIRRLK